MQERKMHTNDQKLAVFKLFLKAPSCLTVLSVYDKGSASTAQYHPLEAFKRFLICHFTRDVLSSALRHTAKGALTCSLV